MTNAIGGQVKSGGSSSQHRAMIAVDIVGFSRPERDSEARLFLHRTLYEFLAGAFEDAQMGWDNCIREDRGDGLLVIMPAHMLSATVVDPLLNRLQARLGRHNWVSSAATRIQMRVAIHSGEVHHDGRGLVGASLNHVFRLLDAPVLKSVLAESGGDLALIISDYFYESVIQREPIRTGPGTFQPVTVAVKETRTLAWLHLPRAFTSVPRQQLRNESGVTAETQDCGEINPTWLAEEMDSSWDDASGRLCRWPVITPAEPDEAGRHPIGTPSSPHSHSDQVLDSILAAGEAEELERIQAGLNLDAGLAAIMQGRSPNPMPATDIDDSGEPQILAQADSNPRSLEVLPFRWVREETT